MQIHRGKKCPKAYLFNLPLEKSGSGEEEKARKAHISFYSVDVYTVWTFYNKHAILGKFLNYQIDLDY